MAGCVSYYYFSHLPRECTLLEIHIFNGMCFSRISYTEIIFLVKGQVQVMRLEECQQINYF